MPTVITGTDGINQVQAGAVESGDLPAGSVIQVVDSSLASEASTSSSSLVATGLSATITPQSESNDILVLVSGVVDTATSGRQPLLQLFRNGLPTTGENFSEPFANNSRILETASLNFVDSPNTTFSTIYEVYFSSSDGGTVTFCDSTSTAHMTLMEIAG